MRQEMTDEYTREVLKDALADLERGINRIRTLLDMNPANVTQQVHRLTAADNGIWGPVDLPGIPSPYPLNSDQPSQEC